jgi:hypothetical protein
MKKGAFLLSLQVISISSIKYMMKERSNTKKKYSSSLLEENTIPRPILSEQNKF